MRWLGVLVILAYRVVVRPFLRRRCLHDEHCSAFGIRMLREHGLWRAVPRIRERVRSCRLPAAACFVVGADGRARLLSVSGVGGRPVPARALEVVAAQAEAAAAGEEWG